MIAAVSTQSARYPICQQISCLRFQLITTFSASSLIVIQKPGQARGLSYLFEEFGDLEGFLNHGMLLSLACSLSLTDSTRLFFFFFFKVACGLIHGSPNSKQRKMFPEEVINSYVKLESQRASTEEERNRERL